MGAAAGIVGVLLVGALLLSLGFAVTMGVPLLIWRVIGGRTVMSYALIWLATAPALAWFMFVYFPLK